MQVNQFFVAGISYKKAEAETRGLFAIHSAGYESLLQTARQRGIRELFVLSTCNRTEIMGIAHSGEDLVSLLCTETTGTRSLFLQTGYIKQGQEAIQHLFEVAAGLDSQILGDYEIVGQLKTAFRFAKDRGFIQGFMERLVNAALQASKKVKNQTELSGGTVSVSFAAIQFIREHVQNVPDKKILLLGVGKIGSNTCKNLVDYLGTRNITLVNRSPEKALELAGKLGLTYSPIEKMAEEVKKADIIVVATNSPEPVLLKSHMEEWHEKLVIDLSIPYNVESGAGDLNHVKLVNVDELSRLKDETLKKRQAEVPKAMAILHTHMEEFMEWSRMRKHVPLLKDLKAKLKQMVTVSTGYHTTSSAIPSIDWQIQRVLNDTADKLKLHNQPGCQYISAIHEFIRSDNR